MSAYGNVEIINGNEFTSHKSKFIYDVPFAFLSDRIGLSTSLDIKEFELIEPYQEDAGFKPRDPKKFKAVFIKIKGILTKNSLYFEYEKDIEAILKLCDKAIKSDKKIDFTWSN